MGLPFAHLRPTAPAYRQGSGGHAVPPARYRSPPRYAAVTSVACGTRRARVSAPDRMRLRARHATCGRGHVARQALRLRPWFTCVHPEGVREDAHPFYRSAADGPVNASAPPSVFPFGIPFPACGAGHRAARRRSGAR